MNLKSNKWDVELYNDKHNFVYEYGEELVRLLNPKAGEAILDLGCGSGQLTHQISESIAKAIGIDSSKSMIESAKLKYPEINFYVKEASNFRFDKPFDAIFSNAVLHWVLESEKAVVSMKNNLKSGGRLVLEFGGKGNVGTILKSVRNVLKSKGYTKESKIKNWYFPDVDEYRILLEKNGFEVEYAKLYERPTELTDTENGIKDWLMMFGNSFFKDLNDNVRNEILEMVQEDVKKDCFVNGKWIADYKRIRILARKV